MAENHLSVADGLVKKECCLPSCMSPLARATICKNMNESRSITKLIYRKEAVLYGKQFVERTT
jgi:hypothetical protein